MIYFLAVLSILVLVHEMGHFIAARSAGVRVEKFSFGFGPKLFSIKGKETEYLISLIPLGGYVKMAGDEPGVNFKNQKWEYLSKSVGERFRIIIAGPLLNYVLAFLIFSVIFMFGSPTLTTKVGRLIKGYPAESHGIAVGDRIVAVDGKSVKYWEDLTEIIHSHKGAMRLTIERNGRPSEKDITPVIRSAKDIFGKETSIALIGIAPSQDIESVRYGFFASFRMGFGKLMQLTAITYKAIWSILIGRLSLKESMTGPIGIFMITGEAAKMGLIYILHLMAILSASLAIFNVLPLPVLDGGHLIFLALEKLRGRPLSVRTQEIFTNVGVGLLILLTVFIFYSDIIKFGIIEKILKIIK